MCELDLNIVYKGSISNVCGERNNARFVVIQDKWRNGDYYLNVYDKMDYMVVGYYDCDDLSTAKEVCDYLNRLNDELIATENTLNEYKSLVVNDKISLLNRVKYLESELERSKNLERISMKYCRDVLLDCLAVYPGDVGLLDFKSTMGW